MTLNDVLTVCGAVFVAIIGGTSVVLWWFLVWLALNADARHK